MGGGAGRLAAAVVLMFLTGCGAPTPGALATDDPLSAADDPGRRVDLLQQLDALPRFEAASRVLAANPVPLDHDVAVATGRQALATSQLTAQVLDRARFPQPLGFDTDAHRAELEAAARGSSLQLAAVARNLDAAQTLLLDPETRRSLLVTPHVDQAGAVALLERVTERVVPVAGSAQGAAEDAMQNAQVAAAVLTDVAQDPYGWRAGVGKGTPISDAITGVVADHIDAFTNADADHPRAVAPVRIDEGFSGGFGLSSQDARDVLTFIGAGRATDGPDTDLVRIHVAAQQFTRYEVVQAASGALDPGTAFGTAADVTVAVHTADFRTAMHVVDDAAAARQHLFANGSLATGLVADEALRRAAAPPGPAGDGIPALVAGSVAGYAPESGQSTAPADAIAGRYRLDTDHLVVSTLAQAGRLPADVPDLDAVTDQTGRVSPLRSFSDAARWTGCAAGTGFPGGSCDDTEPDRPGIRVAGETTSPEVRPVTDGVALSYDTGVLRDGGAGMFGVAAIADSAMQALQAAPLDPVMFGLTPGAPAFAAAVAAARAAQARGFRGESDRAQDVAGRVGTAAALGDGLTADTTGIAQGGR